MKLLEHAYSRPSSVRTVLTSSAKQRQAAGHCMHIPRTRSTRERGTSCSSAAGWSGPPPSSDPNSISNRRPAGLLQRALPGLCVAGVASAAVLARVKPLPDTYSHLTANTSSNTVLSGCLVTPYGNPRLCVTLASGCVSRCQCLQPQYHWKCHLGSWPLTDRHNTEVSPVSLAHVSKSSCKPLCASVVRSVHSALLHLRSGSDSVLVRFPYERYRCGAHVLDVSQKMIDPCTSPGW